MVRSGRISSFEDATKVTSKILEDIHNITKCLFEAYENEYSIFCPMSNCFEHYGLDFMIDNEFNVSLLEVNPGPDFKQTGDRLSGVIVSLWEETLRLVVDSGLISGSIRQSDDRLSHTEIDDHLHENILSTMNNNFSMVYSKEWSVSQLKGGMSFQ